MKYFTLATAAPPPQRTAWGRVYHRRANDDVVLVFDTDDGTELTLEDLERVAEDPLVHKIMDGVFAVNFLSTDNGDQILVHQTKDLIPHPDLSELDCPPVILRSTSLPAVRIDTRRLYETCLSLFRSIGCVNCPDLGQACTGRLYPSAQAILSELKATAYFDDVRDELKNRKTQIAGFTFISPMLTRMPETRDHFAPYARSWAEHDFLRVDSWSKTRSEANKIAAERKKFKREQCVKCPLRDHCKYEFRFRWCDGAFPPDEKIDEELLAEFNRIMSEVELEPWQFMAIAQLAGAEGQIGRRACILDGFVFPPSGDGLQIRASRNKTSATMEKLWPVTKLDYENIAAYFNLPKTREEAAKLPEPTDRAKALWMASLHTRHGAPRRCGWGSRYDDIGYRKLERHNVEIGLRGPTCVWTTRSASSWNSYADIIGDPPVAQERARARRW